MEKLPDKITIGGVTLDRDYKTVYVNGRDIGLTRMEYALLRTLMESPDKPLDRRTLLTGMWDLTNCPEQIETRLVDVYIGYLRKKLPADFIKTRVGFGYAVYTK